MDLSYSEVLSTLIVAHTVADHVLQDDDQAALKMEKSRRGWAHGLWHAADHLFLSLGLLLFLAIAKGAAIDWPWTLLGLTLIAVSHLIVDRRRPVLWLMRHTGSARFAEGQGPIYGPYVVDQAVHFLFLCVGSMTISFGLRGLLVAAATVTALISAILISAAVRALVNRPVQTSTTSEVP